MGPSLPSRTSDSIGIFTSFRVTLELCFSSLPVRISCSICSVSNVVFVDTRCLFFLVLRRYSFDIDFSLASSPTLMPSRSAISPFSKKADESCWPCNSGKLRVDAASPVSVEIELLIKSM